MGNSINNFIRSFFKGHDRTVNVKKNILFSLILKGFSILTSLLIVPILLKYLGSFNYGIWMTINSFLAWFLFFDLGLGNGLRNKLAEALSKNDMDSGRIYVSTTYIMLSIIILIFLIFFIIIFPFIDWTVVFKAPAALRSELNTVVFIVFLFFSIQFVLKLVGTILTAHQKPALNDLIIVLGSTLSMVIIFFISKLAHNNSLLIVGIVFSATPLIVYIGFSYYIFLKKYPALRPSIKMFDKKHIKGLFSLSFKFFILQAIYLLIFSTSNIIIIQYLGPEEVTIYNIAFAYMGISTMIFETIRNPFWSAYTDSYYKDDMQWIRSMTKYLMIVWGLLTLMSVVMIIASQFIFKLWVGKDVHVPIMLCIWLGIYVSILNWNNIYSTVLCGVGKITVQFYCCIILGILFIPTSVYLCSNYGLNGLILSIILTLIPGMILAPYQYYKIIHRTDTGIWSK